MTGINGTMKNTGAKNGMTRNRRNLKMPILPMMTISRILKISTTRTGKNTGNLMTFPHGSANSGKHSSGKQQTLRLRKKIIISLYRKKRLLRKHSLRLSQKFRLLPNPFSLRKKHSLRKRLRRKNLPKRLRFLRKKVPNL